jgi:hypothetical protein
VQSTFDDENSCLAKLGAKGRGQSSQKVQRDPAGKALPPQATPQREQWFTRGASAELLIDAGAVVAPSVLNGLVDSRARGLLELFQRKGLLPHTLKFLAALGDVDAIRAALGENGNDLATVAEALVSACRFGHEAVASLLLERSIALDPELGAHVDGSLGRLAFIKYFIDTRVAHATTAVGPWTAFVMEQVSRAAHDGDVEEAERQREQGAR